MLELKTILEQLNIPVAYDHFNTPTAPPFIAYKRYSQSNFGADNKVYEKINNYYVELYTEYKDVNLEERLEDLLNDYDIFFNVESEDYIYDEKMYQIIYQVSFKDYNKDLLTERSINIEAEGQIFNLERSNNNGQ